MKQRSIAVVWLVLMLAFSGQLAAQDSKELLQFESEQQRRIYAQLTAELRCPQCQNQNIADSNAVVAVDMREKTHELVLQGYNRQQVLDYMIERYGNFVHYQPPVNPFTVWLWLLPLFMLLALLAFQWRRRNAQTGDAQVAVSDTSAAGSNTQQQDELNQQLDQIIERYRSKKS